MRDATALMRSTTKLRGVQEVERAREGFAQEGGPAVEVERASGARIDLAVLDGLMKDLRRRIDLGEWRDASESDRWLAPRVHYALRLTRTEAADKGAWQWLALRYDWYVEWRWSNSEAGIAEDRWWGPVHKQALARLWWGAEMFRNGGDYRTVERAFVMQDFPNSYLHRTVVRCRSLTLAVLDRLSREENLTAHQVNALARTLNLSTAGSPPEMETGFAVDDIARYQDWAASVPSAPGSWDKLPEGPPCVDTTVESIAGGAHIVDLAWAYAAGSPAG